MSSPDPPAAADVVVMPEHPPVMPEHPPVVPGPVAPPPPPPVEAVPSPWAATPLAPRSWRLGGLLLDGVLVICTVGVGWLAWWIIAWDYGRSPAKTILRTRVVRADNRELPGFARMALREAVGKGVPGGLGVIGLYLLSGGSSVARFLIAMSLAWLAMSAVAALLDDNRRALWDVFAKTIVVLDPEVSPPIAEPEPAPEPAVSPLVDEQEAEVSPTGVERTEPT